MRIRSIHVRNYRVIRDFQFSLDSGLTLLGGPNETGKSTLVEAIRSALFLKAGTNNELVKSMKSRTHQGIPEVTLHFEMDKKEYKLHKLFSGGNGTVTLTEVGGRTWHSDAAEDQLAVLTGVKPLGGRGGSRDAVGQQWAHLWVAQGKSGVCPDGYANDQLAALMDRLQTEGGAAMMQSALDGKVADRVAKETDELFTNARKPRAGSALEQASQRSDRATDHLMKADQTLARLRQAVSDLQAAEPERERYQAELASLEGEARQLNGKLEMLAELTRRKAGDEQACQGARASHGKLREADATIRHLQRTVNERNAALQPRRDEVQRAEAAEKTATGDLANAERAFEAAANAGREVRLRRDFAAACCTRLEREAALASLEERLKQAEEVLGQVRDYEAARAGLPVVDDAKLQELRTLQNEHAKADAALQAMAAGIHVLASDQPVQVDGSTLVVGDSKIVTEDCEIAIGAAVRLRISPGGGTRLQDARTLVQDRRRAFQDALDLVGVASLDVAAEACTKRRELASGIETCEARLKGLGFDSLATEIDASRTSLLAAKAEVELRGGLVVDPVFPGNLEDAKVLLARIDIEQQNAEDHEATSKRVRDVAVQVREQSIETLRNLRLELQEELDELKELQLRIAVVQETYGDENTRSQALADLQRALESAERQLADTNRAIMEMQPDLLMQDKERLPRSIQQCREMLQEQATRIAVAQNALASEGASDPQAACEVAEAEAKFAAEQLAVQQRSADAVAMLHDLFASEKQRLADRFTQPLAGKIDGYLQCLFGVDVKAQVTMNENRIAGLGVSRPDRELGLADFDGLGAGTREQVGAAFRLAMAEVLAKDSGGCLPVIFDDAFVNSDPQRVSALNRMLFRAAQQGLQVIVLSCTPGDYTGLGGEFVRLDALRPALARDEETNANETIALAPLASDDSDTPSNPPKRRGRPPKARPL